MSGTGHSNKKKNDDDLSNAVKNFRVALKTTETIKKTDFHGGHFKQMYSVGSSNIEKHIDEIKGAGYDIKGNPLKGYEIRKDGSVVAYSQPKFKENKYTGWHGFMCYNNEQAKRLREILRIA